MSKKELDQNVQNIEKLIDQNLTEKEGVIETDKDTFRKIVEDNDMDYEMAEKLSKLTNDTLVAFTSAVGKRGVNMMGNNDTLKQVSAKLPMVGGDYATTSVARERTYPNPQNRDETITTYGATTTNYVAEGSVKKGNLKVAKELIQELAKETYGKK